MTKSKDNPITSCTLSWENSADASSTVIKVLQTEIQVRQYHRANLIGGSIWPMSTGEKLELYSILYRCLEDWDCDDYTVDICDDHCWQFKICAQRHCLKTVSGTVEPPHGQEIRRVLSGIIGEENCRFF